MKKRLLSILLMCCMVLTLLPMTAYAMTLTVRPVEISSREYATVDDLETNSGAVITLGKNSRGRNGNQKWYVFGKDNGVNGRNTVLFAATSLTDPSGFEQREVFQRVLGATRIDYDSSWGSSYTDGAAAPTEVDISYYAASYSRWRLRNTIAYDNKLFNRVEKALLNETPYKNTDLGNNNRVYTLKDKLYLPAINASEEDTIYIGSNDQIRLKSIQVQSTQADYCNAAWSRTACDAGQYTPAVISVVYYSCTIGVNQSCDRHQAVTDIILIRTLISDGCQLAAAVIQVMLPCHHHDSPSPEFQLYSRIFRNRFSALSSAFLRHSFSHVFLHLKNILSSFLSFRDI